MFSRRVVLIAVLLLISTGIVGGVVADIDGDGIPSYRELSAGIDPLADDTDGDGLSDDVEYEFGSDPTLADTDDDGLDDRAEYDGVNRGGNTLGNVPFEVSWERSDPRSPHSDSDDIPDGEEAELDLDPTSEDTDRDGLPDQREVEGPTDPGNPDTDGDNLLDAWEVEGETDKGAPLPGADPLHKDMYVQVTYLRGTDHQLPAGVFSRIEEWYADMPVENPDGAEGITVHIYANDEYSGPVNQSIDEWTKSNGKKTNGVSGFMAMREFYNREYMGPRVGSYFLVVVADDSVSVRGSGNAGGSKTAIVRSWPGDDHGDQRRMAHTITHEMLHNIVRKIGGRDCDGQMHTCEGFLSYENHYYLSEKSTDKLNEEGFADPVYPEQMNATSCEDTINDPSECGT